MGIRYLGQRIRLTFTVYTSQFRGFSALNFLHLEKQEGSNQETYVVKTHACGHQLDGIWIDEEKKKRSFVLCSIEPNVSKPEIVYVCR
ncbi:hypothetical protein KQX54_016425 [Cotesia glomerata]|uniref:Uncharacterized protein n=1 Tax=Cotesia glomerata TaxID=32391 RepID=A0AAV7HUQ2_COTGL|nr:hypothetical protein KQX54_016425 [Cotesia glomerata]